MTNINEKINIILKACDDKKGYNFSIINISEISSVCDYYILCSGNNDRQTVAISDEIDDKMSKAGYELYHLEGAREGRWVLMDYDDIIVHIFHKDERDVYDLETLWNQGVFIDSEQFGIKNWK